MRRLFRIHRELLQALVLLLTLSAPLAAQDRPGHATAARPILFTENRGQLVDTRGQLRPDLLYKAESGGVELYLSATSLSYVFTSVDGDLGRFQSEVERLGQEKATPIPVRTYRMDVELIGARSAPEIVPEEGIGFYDNFYLAHCPQGVTHVPSYRKLLYRDVYPGIDMVLAAREHGVKCDFIVRPGGRVSDIRLRYVAAERLEVTGSGSLLATTPLGTVEEDAPLVYQADDAAATVPARYRIDGDVVSFDVGPHDRSRTLVIDPTRQWATFYGGGGTEKLSGGDPSEVDRSGNVLIAGYATSNPFPTSTGAAQRTFGGGGSFGDAFVVKFDGQGNRLWATYYGGTSDEIAHGVATDRNRNVFIAGHTANGFPVYPTSAYQSTFGGGTRDAFIVKFDSTGARLWASYYGGNQFDDGYGFAADSSGDVAMLITTMSSGLGTSGTFQSSKQNGTNNNDALVAKFSSSGSLLWASYYGGGNDDYGYAAASDTNDNIYITGWTNSSNFPVSTNAAQGTLGGSYDAFLVKLNSSGSRQWATFYGGSGRENQDPSNVGYCGVATDGASNVCIAGSTTGGFPTTPGASQAAYGGGTRDGFAVKFNTSGQLQWASYCGGSGDDAATGCASNLIGGVLLTGFTYSNNFPVTATANQWPYGGGGDAFIMKLDSSGTRQWSTYYGGNGTDEGEGISFDPFGSIMVAGHTSNNNLPVINAFQGTNAGGYDAFMVLFCDIERPLVDSTGPKSICQGDSVTLFVPPGYARYQWYINNVPSSSDTLYRVVAKRASTFSVKVWNSGGCYDYSDTVRVNVLARPQLMVQGPRALCTGDTTLLDVGPGYTTYLWSNGAITPSIRVWEAGAYKVTVTNAQGCSDSTTLVVTMNPRPSISVIPAIPQMICEGDSVLLVASTSGDATAVVWSDGRSGDRIWASKSGAYVARVLNKFGCVGISDTVKVEVHPKPQLQIAPAGKVSICRGDSVVITATAGLGRYRWSGTGSLSDTVPKIVVRNSGTYAVTVTDATGCSARASLDVEVTDRPSPRLARTGTDILCDGDSLVLDAGPGFSSYVWSNGEVGQRMVVREPGTYFAVVASGRGCEGHSDTVLVRSFERPRAVLSGPVRVCANGTSLYGAGFAGNAAYTWSVIGTGATIIAGGTGTDSLRVRWGATGAATVILRVRDTVSGCYAEKRLDVEVGTALQPSIAANRAPSLCASDTVVLDAGPGYASYHWSTGETSRTIVVRSPGVYLVDVIDPGGCIGRSLPFEVKGQQSPAPSISLAASSFCQGDSVLLDAGAFASYRWSTGATTRRIYVSKAGSYYVTVVDSNGCNGTSRPVALTVAPLPTPVIEGPTSVCLSSRVDYDITAPAKGSVYTWSVSNGGAIVAGQGSPRITVQWGGAGKEQVSVREQSGATLCVGDATPLDVTISSELMPTVNVAGGTRLCQGDSATLTAPAGYARYRWSNGATSRSIRVGASGSYGVEVADRFGCSGSSPAVTIEVVPRPRPVVSPDLTTICDGERATLGVDGIYQTYRWSTGETTPVITVDKPGLYSVTVTDQAGCDGVSRQVRVVVLPRPEVPSIAMKGDTLVASSGARFAWTREGAPVPGGAAGRLVTQDTGVFTVTVTNDAGCSVTSAPFTVSGRAVAVVSLPVIEAAPGERVIVPVTLDSSRNLKDLNARDYSFRLRFNRTLLHPADPSFEGVDADGQRYLKVAGVRPSGLGQGTLGEVELIAALGDAVSTPLVIEAFRFNDTTVAVTAFNGLFKLRGLCEAGGTRLIRATGETGLKPSRPNPVAGIAEIEYETVETGPTRLYLSDLLGRRVATLVDANVTAGRYQVMLDASVLPTGLYYCVLETPTMRLNRPLQVAR